MSRIDLSVARLALRLYPRAWRERYGDELLALVDERRLGIFDVTDLCVGAAFERLSAPWAGSAQGTFARAGLILIGLGFVIVLINSSATVVAMLLVHIPTPPRVWIEHGQTLVSPPPLPSWFSGFGSAIPIAALIRGVPRFLRGLRATNSVILAHPAKLQRREILAWAGLAFIGSATHQWGSRVANLGTGLAPWPWWWIWCTGATGVYMTLFFLLMPSGGISRLDYERRRAEQFEELRRLAPRFPLGLGDDRP